MAVYFAQAGPYIKIGYSANPMNRVESVTRLGRRPDDLPRGADTQLIGWVPGDRARESELHRQFADCHVAGEWFYIEVDTARDLIWADPRGVDIQRMSAHAVVIAVRYPEATRDQMAAAGIAVDVSLDEAMDKLDALLGGAS